MRGTACPHASTTLHAGLVVFSDEAADRVVRVELLALQLGARRGRGVVGLEPLLDGAALVRMAIYLFKLATERVRRWASAEDPSKASVPS